MKQPLVFFVRLGALCLVVLAGSPTWAWQAEAPAITIDETPKRIIDDEAYDEIILNDEERTSVKVRPIELKKRSPVDPTSYRKSDKLIVRMIEDPTDDREVRWGDIAEVKLFEYMVLDKARELVQEGKQNEDAGKFDEAYDYFGFLKQNYPRTEGLKAALADYLYEDAGYWVRDKHKNYENALALLNELFEVDPQYARLPNALGAVTKNLIEPMIAADDYAAARRAVARLAQKFPQSPVVKELRDKWAEEARQLIAQGRQIIEEGRPREAWDLAQRVLHVWPHLPEAKRFFTELYAAWPRVVVGVTSATAPLEQPRLASWSARRDGRLLHRLLMEYVAPGAEGGQYFCPFGEVERTDIGRRLLFRLKRDIRSSAGGGHLTGYDVARQLLALADSRQPGAEPTWAELFGGVNVQDVYQVDADLRWSYVQPLALLETPVAPLKTDAAPDAIGPYTLDKSDGNQSSFVESAAYFDAQPDQPKEIVERYLADSSECWAALERGRVLLLDRIAPWEVERYQEHHDFVVEQYALPTIHCLAPNFERPFMRHGCYRRALAYAIDRQLVLDHHVLRDKPMSGCKLISGPFPIGGGFDDPLRYAYNTQVAQRDRNPRLAIALSQVALHDLSEAAKKRGEPEITAFPKLVLAHPANDIAREACKGLQRHIKALKFPVELRELEPGIALPSDKNYDLLFLELSMQEPLVEAARLLGPDGIVGESNQYMTLALVQLAKSTNWQEARAILERIHQLAADSLPVIPLWQMPEHFAYHRDLKGVGSNPVLLYQNVEAWRGAVRVPREE